MNLVTIFVTIFVTTFSLRNRAPALSISLELDRARARYLSAPLFTGGLHHVALSVMRFYFPTTFVPRLDERRISSRPKNAGDPSQMGLRLLYQIHYVANQGSELAF